MQTFPRTIPTRCCFAASIALLACADESEVEDTCAWVISPDECKKDNGDTGDPFDDPSGDTGGDTGGEDAQVDPYRVCLTERNGHTKSLHQCAGEISVSLEFDTVLGDCGKTLGDDDLCTEVHHFGPGQDSETSPAVMACCDVLDPDDPNAGEQEAMYLQYCAADSVEQICRSLPMRLQKYINDGRLGVGKNQAQKLQSWLAQEENLQACYDALYDRSDVLGQLPESAWLVNGGKNSKWRMLRNFTVRLDYGYVEAVELSNGPVSCVDNNLNNTEVFEGHLPPSEHTPSGLAAPVNADVVGPEVLGGRLEGVVPVAGGTASSSSATPVSELQIDYSTTERAWILREFELLADGDFTVGNGAVQLELERTSARMYGTSLGHPVAGTSTVVFEARTVGFVITGVHDGVYEVLWATNATPIVATQGRDWSEFAGVPTNWSEFAGVPTNWTLDAFELEHLDTKQRQWTIQVPATTWTDSVGSP